MKTTHLRTIALSALGLSLAAAAFAAAPQPRISGNGPAGIFGMAPLQKCGGSIGNGLAAYGDGPWSCCQSFVADGSGVNTISVQGLSANGFTSVTLVANIYTDNGLGFPGTLLASSTPTTVSGLPNYPAVKRASVSFPSGASLSAGSSYVIEWTAVPGSGACFVLGSASDVCADGSAGQNLGDGNGYFTYVGASGTVDLFHGVK